MLYSNASNVPDDVEGDAGVLRSALANQGLLTDLYQFTMAQGYWLNAPRKQAIFNYFVRRAPFGSDYFVLAGIEPLLESIENLAFSGADVAYLASLGHFRPEFLAWLREFRFKGDVCAVGEGRPAFAGEPVLRVEGSLLEAELVSGLILAHLNYQTLVATKAARIVDAAGGKPIVELGVRRAHGLAGSVYGARAAYVAGVDLTSNVLAGKLFGLSVAGTMAHSWVMSFASEAEAFAAYAQIYPQNCTLLIDTFGATHGLSAAIPVLKGLLRRGAQSLGVRTDSGDPTKIVPVLRERLDAQGLASVRIVLSGDLDEHKVAELVSARLPVDVFGVGSRLMSAHDDPALSGVYKLAACGDESALTPCMKHSDSHTVRYFGVLAPAAKWRLLVVPKPRQPATTQEASSSAPCQTSPCPESVGPRYRPWAELLKRTFAVDVETCPHCGGRMRLLAVITEPQNVARFLRHRGEPTEPPARAPPRAPPYFKSLVVRRRPSTETSPQGELFEEH